jgi:hypothetical protein
MFIHPRMDQPHGSLRRLLPGLLIPLILAACNPEPETTGSIGSCAAELYSTFRPKALDECVAVCRHCERGTISTCSTTCTMNGAH